MARLATSLAVLALLVAGCGGEDDDETAATTATTSATTTTSEPTATTGDDAGAGADEPGGPGADQPPPAPRPTSIEDVTRAVFTGSADPSVTCEQLATERFVRQAYGAPQGCVAAQRPGALAGSIEMRALRKSGDSATAIVIPTGGPYDEVEVEVELVVDPATEGAWQVDSLLADLPAGP